MIYYNPKSWISLIFSIHKSDTLRILWLPMLYVLLLTLTLAYIEINYLKEYTTYFEKILNIYQLIGFVISLLLVFRTNTAYDRWWEGRKQWGALMNASRSAVNMLSSFGLSEEDRLFLGRHLKNFPIALMYHLRNQDAFLYLKLTEEEKQTLKTKEHQPFYLSNLLIRKISSLRKSGAIDDFQYLEINRTLQILMDVCGACERIKKTPIPFSYSLFFKKFIFLYILTMPFAFVPSMGYYACFVSIFVFYVLVSIEVLAEEIEDPFGEDDNDLPTDSISEGIGKSVDEYLS
ncbi:MAG: hypothetical protein J0G96_05280 [Flavobacteriia bacterium]|nr:hypothetical protein [Flavobacteriia bacterium]OJX35135.1 MAG: hypothetical protein BGO87_08220 [Flavobacteriia bacterium 40-80]